MSRLLYKEGKGKNVLKISPQTSIYTITYAALKRAELGHRKLSVDGVKVIIDAVVKVFNLNIRDLTGRCRIPEYVVPRHLAMYLCSVKTKATSLQIAQAFGDRDHTTILYAVKKIKGFFDVIDETDETFLPYWEKWINNAPKYLV
jgi:chromosomal replication initiation ATPase DnaA